MNGKYEDPQVTWVIGFGVCVALAIIGLAIMIVVKAPLVATIIGGAIIVPYAIGLIVETIID